MHAQEEGGEKQIMIPLYKTRLRLCSGAAFSAYESETSLLAELLCRLFTMSSTSILRL